jgi:hypothetical protein
MSFRGYYINLDRSPERRARIENQLSRYGLAERYARVAAVDGSTVSREPPHRVKSGEYGCFASHVAALRAASASDSHIHVLEDDAVLSQDFFSTMNRIVGQRGFEQLDLLFTDIGISPDSVTVGAIERIVRADHGGFKPMTLVDLRSLNFTCTTSYFVARRSIDKLRVLLEESLRAGPELPIDLELRRLVRSGQLRAAVSLPFLTSVDPELDVDSTIRAPDPSRIAINVLRQLYFVGADWAAIEKMLEKFCAVPAVDRDRAAILRVIAFTMFGEFRMP